MVIKRSLFLILVCIVMGASFWPATIRAQENQNTVVIAMQPPADLEAATISRFDENKRDILENLFVGLTRFNANSGQIEPYLAKDWTVSPDGLTWTFNLRDDIQWVEVQNGEPTAVRPVVAGDIVFAIQRACDPNRPSPVTSNMAIIVGCREVATALDSWEITQEALDQRIGVKALDDQTVEFKLLFPAAYFLTLTALPEFRPLPPERVIGSNLWPVGTDMMTSSAWVVTSWDALQMTLEANPFWPLEREGNLDSVTIRFDVGADVLPSRFASGDVAIARTDALTAASIGATDSSLVKIGEGETLTLLGFSMEYPDLNNPLLRRALALAIDHDYIAQNVVVGDAKFLAATRFTPRSVIAAPSAPGAGFDPVTAQSLLAESGHANCSFSERLRIAVENDAIATLVAQLTIQQWQINLGCSDGTFELVVLTRQEVVNNVHANIDFGEEQTRHPLWFITWSADYPDANAWAADALHCQFGYLRVGRACDNTDVLFDQAGLNSDIRSRLDAYTRAETELFGPSGSFPVIPIVINSQIRVQQKWLSGVANYGPFQFDRWVVNRGE
ncbi:MAG: peptide ABC transporter substrate-binding protein [Chloroflexota bacterium]|nr:hypothetical protein [Chloroflexota bacterium]NOG65991.1 hypothetical protein [Chloroflexota bacterium]GIK65416.1 MAG: peptide ABC transporter substrate-binding protein [Chloroflexota bacterium]